MCGIAGMISINPDVDVTCCVTRMTASLKHRGPDGHGVKVRTYPNGVVGIGHTRLSILDLSEAGSQPMTSAYEEADITYNGEVYNFLELRQELEARGRTFHSGTDTEVVLEAFTLLGPSCLDKLRGMYAFGIWDEKSQTLTLARDPFGIKPLYYANVNGTFVFSSEIRTILGTGLVDRRLSQAGLIGYLRTGSPEAPLTMVDGIHSLRPGEYLQVSLGNTLIVSEPVLCRNPVDVTQEKITAAKGEIVDALWEMLKASVNLHLISDVPLGVFLSGGIDSSALVALLSRVTDERPKTFSVVFAEEQFSEQTQAKLVAEWYETDHQEIHLSESDLLSALPCAFRAMDQPSVDGFNTYVISRAVREAGVPVALSGLGGDELFAGYQSFRRAKLLKPFHRIPYPIRGALANVGRRYLNNSVQHSKLWDMLASDGSPAATYEITRRMFSPTEIERLSGQSGPRRLRGTYSNGVDPINSVSRLEMSGYMANTLLRDTDAMSMAHALEVRVPFVDRIVAECVLAIPGAWKVARNRPKPLLLDTLGGALPEAVWNRPKMGFSLPFERWMRSAIRDSLVGSYEDHAALEAAGLHAASARAIWQRFDTRPELEKWSRPWSLHVLQEWCKRNGVYA